MEVVFSVSLDPIFHFQVTFPDAANVKLTMTVVRVEEHDFSLKLETFKLAEDLFVSSFGHSKAIEGKSSNLTPQPVTQEMSYDCLFQAQCERSKQIRDRSLPFPSPQTNVSCYDSVTLLLRRRPMFIRKGSKRVKKGV